MNKLTLVLTSFNRINFLKEMVQSLQKQSDLNFDLIICDNHSTDGSWSYIDNIKKFNLGNYIKIHWEENKGWAGSAEKWSKYIRTEWVSILCDDDWLGINFVEVLTDSINKSPKNFAGLIVTGHKRVNIAKHFEKEYRYSERLLNVETAVDDFYHQKFDVAGISGFALQSTILKTDFPKYYEGNGFLEDTLIIYRAMLSGGVKFTEGIHYFRREHSDNISAPQKSNLYYRLAMIRFKHDIKTYVEIANCGKKISSRLISYNIIQHFKGLLKEVVIQGRSFSLYMEYVKNVKEIDRIKYYQSLIFYPIIGISVLIRNLLHVLHVIGSDIYKKKLFYLLIVHGSY